MQWIASHWAVVIAPCLVTIIATFINVTKELPDSPAKTWTGAILRTLYRLLVDLPAARQMQGARGRWQVPYFQVSRRKRDLPKIAATLMFVLLGSLAFTSSSGCIGPKDVTDCAKIAASESFARVMPIVADLVTHGSDWKAEVTELAAAYGKPFVDCIVHRLFERWDGQVKSGAPGLSPDIVRGRDRAAEWLKGAK